MRRAKIQREAEEEKRRHREEMAPKEALSKRENYALAERRCIQSSRKIAGEYRSHSSGKRKRINSNPELSREVVNATRRIHKLVKRRRNSSGDQCQLNTTQLEDMRRPDSGDRRNHRIALLDRHLPPKLNWQPTRNLNQKIRLRKARRDLHWKHSARKWRHKDERYNEELEDGGKEAGTSFKRWIDRCADINSEDDSDSNPYTSDGSCMSDHDLGSSDSDDDDYDEGNHFDRRCQNGTKGLSHQMEVPLLKYSGSQAKPTMTSSGSAKATDGNENHAQNFSESPNKRKRDDQVERRPQTRKVYSQGGMMRGHRNHTTKRLKPNFDSEDEEPRQRHRSKGKTTSSPVK